MWISCFSVFCSQTLSKDILFSVSASPFSCPSCLEYLRQCTLILLKTLTLYKPYTYLLTGLANVTNMTQTYTQTDHTTLSLAIACINNTNNNCPAQLQVIIISETNDKYTNFIICDLSQPSHFSNCLQLAKIFNSTSNTNRLHKTKFYLNGELA